MTELSIEYKQSEIRTNFEDVKEAVSKEVDRYAGMDVTEENIPEAKKTMANLNKVKTQIANQYKEYINKLSEPINKLKNEKKELEGIISQGREKIAEKVAVYEQKRLETAKDVILRYVISVCAPKRLNHEAIQTDDLVKLTAITTSGNLAKATREAIDSRVATLENEVLKAKLEAEEKAKRDREIAEKARLEAEERARQREIQLQREAEERIRLERERAEREKQEAMQRARIEAQKERIGESATVVQKVAPKESEDGKIIYTVLATFEVKAPKGIDDEKIKMALSKKLESAGITSCKSIEVMR